MKFIQRKVNLCKNVSIVNKIIFSSWLLKELDDRGWSKSDLAKYARISHASISNVLSGARQPGPDLCTAIARAFKYPPKIVFEVAGLLPPEPETNAGFEEWAYMLSQLPEQDRDELLQIARMKLDRQEKEEQRKSASKKKGAGGKEPIDGADIR